MVKPKEGIGFEESSDLVDGDLDGDFERELLGLVGDNLGVDPNDFFGEESLTLPSFDDSANLFGDFVGEGVLESIVERANS